MPDKPVVYNDPGSSDKGFILHSDTSTQMLNNFFPVFVFTDKEVFCTVLIHALKSTNSLQHTCNSSFTY